MALGGMGLSEDIKSTLTATYVEHRDALKRFLVARFRDEDIAEDIVQEVYLRLNRSSFDREIKNPVAFLYRVTNNLALDYRRGQQRRGARDKNWSDVNHNTVGNETIHDQPDADDALDAKKKVALIVKALDNLPPQCRKVFIAHKFEGLTHREVAEKFGVSRGTVEKHMAKALKYLVLHLKDKD